MAADQLAKKLFQEETFMSAHVRVFAVMVVCFAMAAASFAIQIEGFNYNNDSEAQAEWIVAGNDSGMGGSLQVYAEATEKQEGLSSLKFEYAYSGNQWYEMSVTKTLASPIDLSEAKKFTMWVYIDAAASADLLWYIRFYSSNGYTWRYVDWTVYDTTGWKEITFGPWNMETDRWVYGASGSFLDNPLINEIDKIQIIAQQRSGIGSGGTATFYFDDLQYFTENDELGETVIEDFEYANDTELQAVWNVTAPAGYSLAISRSTNAAEGSAAMQMAYHIENYWTNVWCLKVFDTPVNMTDVDYFTFWVYGDSGVAALHPVMLFTLEDVGINRIWAHCRSGLKIGGWSRYYLPLDIATETVPAPFHQDNWDAGGVFDLSQINKIGLATQGTVSGESYDFTVVVDQIIMGRDISLSAHEAWAIYE